MGKKRQPCWLQLTLVGAETIFAVVVKVVCGGAPQEAVVTTLRGTAVVLRPHKEEGEFTELSVGIPKLHLHHFGTKKVRSTMLPILLGAVPPCRLITKYTIEI